MATKSNLMLDPSSKLGKDALSYWEKLTGSSPEYMRLTGDGFIGFGWREDLPDYTTQEHFTDEKGKYDAGENKVSIYTIVDGQKK